MRLAMEIRPILSALLRNKTGPLLVAIQVALSLAILSNALHIVNVRQAVAARPSGVSDEASVFSISIRRLGPTSHELQIAAQKNESATLRALSGVLSVAKVNQFPLGQSGSTNGVAVARNQLRESANAAYFVSPDSLVSTWGLKLVEGNDFAAADVLERSSSTSDELPHVAIITRALANKLWPGAASVVGKPIFYGTEESSKQVQVIGVVERLQSPNAQLGEEGEYATIVPIRGTGSVSSSSYTVRAEPGQADRVMKEAEAALRRISSGSVIVRAHSMSKDRSSRYKADVALAWMLVSVSVLLLLITASGIVGMASLWVTQRRKQIGVRRALGARRIDVLRYFLTENIMITSAGIGAGVLLAIGLNQLLVSRLEMARLPIAFLVVGALVFWGLGILAVYGPAWRAASTSPALATRSA
jgi:putative ABC transport system permease protein